MTVTRGTSNGNANGSAADRAARRAWLIETWRADKDARISTFGDVYAVELGTGGPTCRCYRCGLLLIDVTALIASDPALFDAEEGSHFQRRLAQHHVTVDRIVPGCKGGTYRRNNIRPACGGCNSETGGAVRGGRKR